MRWNVEGTHGFDKGFIVVLMTRLSKTSLLSFLNNGFPIVSLFLIHTQIHISHGGGKVVCSACGEVWYRDILSTVYMFIIDFILLQTNAGGIPSSKHKHLERWLVILLLCQLRKCE